MKKKLLLKIVLFCFIAETHSLIAINIDSLKIELSKAKEDTNKVIILSSLADSYLEKDPSQTIRFAKQAQDLSKKLNYNRGVADGLNQEAKANLTRGNYNGGRDLAVEALALARKIKYITGEGISYSTIGTSYIYQSEFDSALSNYQKAINAYNTTNDKEKIAGVNNNIGLIYQLRGDLKKALGIYLQSLKLYRELNEKEGISKSMYSIAGIYSDQKNYEQALLYYTNAMTLSREMENNRALAASLTGMGSIYYLQLNYSKAKDYFLQALDVNIKMQDKNGMVASLDAIGSIYDMEGDYANSLKYHLQSLQISRETRSNHAIALSLLNIGNLYIRSGNSPKAIEYLKSSLSVADSIDEKKIIYLDYQSFSEAYEKQGDFKSALKYHQLFTGLKDSIFNTENSTQINELSAKFENEKKEKEIAVLNADVQSKEKEKAVLNTKVQKRTTVIYIIFFCAFLLLLSLSFFFKRRQLVQKNKHSAELYRQQENTAISVLEEQEKERGRIAKDLHDSVGTSLSTLKINLQLFEGAIPGEKIALYDSSLKLIDTIAAELRNIMYNLTDETLQESGLTSAFEELTERVNRLGITHFDFHSSGITERPESIIEQSLYRVGQELITNCIKHSGAGNATLQLIERNDRLLLMMEDNGKGMGTPEIRSVEKDQGMGLKNVRDRIAFIKGSIRIESDPVNGTTIIIESPKHLS